MCIHSPSNQHKTHVLNLPGDYRQFEMSEEIKRWSIWIWGDISSKFRGMNNKKNALKSSYQAKSRIFVTYMTQQQKSNRVLTERRRNFVLFNQFHLSKWKWHFISYFCCFAFVVIFVVVFAMCVCLYIYIQTHTHTHTHTYIYIYIHTHTHTHTHVHVAWPTSIHGPFSKSCAILRYIS